VRKGKNSSGTGFPAGQGDSLERACPEPVEELSYYQIRAGTTKAAMLQQNRCHHLLQFPISSARKPRFSTGRQYYLPYNYTDFPSARASLSSKAVAT
jgi:hypothetical protein